MDAGTLKHDTYNNVLNPKGSITLADGSQAAIWDLNNLNQTIESVSFGGLDATNTAQGTINTGTGVLTLGGTSSAAQCCLFFRWKSLGRGDQWPSRPRRCGADVPDCGQRLPRPPISPFPP